MTWALKQKKKRTVTTQRSRRVGDMTTGELRALIEGLIDHKLARGNAEPLSERAITASMRQRAISAAGRFHSGHSDISIHHDDHLCTSYLK